MRKEYSVCNLTRAELGDLMKILKICKEQGFYCGRQDYWSMHLGKIIYEVGKSLRYAESEELKQDD
ncbi:MAG: hypothetical protein J6S85_12450 [Methanobrevibacter sp.]|nr:hypothetical protein [Methanobrevibacter sp.]